MSVFVFDYMVLKRPAEGLITGIVEGWNTCILNKKIIVLENQTKCTNLYDNGNKTTLVDNFKLCAQSSGARRRAS